MEKYCITVPEFAKRMSVSPAKAYNIANMESFYPAIRMGGRILVCVNALEKWLSEQTAV